MEEATGAPSSFADWDPRRLRASGRDGGWAMTTQHLSPFTMLLRRHTRRREFITLLGGARARRSISTLTLQGKSDDDGVRQLPRGGRLIWTGHRTPDGNDGAGDLDNCSESEQPKSPGSGPALP